MRNVKLLVSSIARRLGCSPLAVSLLRVSLLDASRAEQATASVAIELLAAGTTEPPEWVRFLVPGPNKARDGRGFFTVADVDEVVRLSTEYKGAIDLIVCFEHQFDRSKQNGLPAPAAAWIKELSAKGPDGSPGIWARVDWLPDTAALIRARKYRYLSAVIAHDDQNVVRFVPRATLTNQPAVDTATALFSVQPKETDVTLLQKLLAALGLAATVTEDKAIETAKGLATLAAAIAKSMNIDVAALSVMTADHVSAAIAKPFYDKIATLATTAKVAADATPELIVAGLRAQAVDPTAFVPMSVHTEMRDRLATLAAETKGRLIDEATKAGKLLPKQREWAESLSHDQLTAYLSTAVVIVAPGSGGGGKLPGTEVTVATLSAEQKAEADKFGVSHENYAKTLNDSAPKT